MSSKRRRPSDQDWEDRKCDIIQMFVAEGLSLPKIVERLAADGFSISASQLEYRLKTIWGVCKKIPRGVAKPLWQYVDHKTRKRKREQDKDSEVFLYGQRVPPMKVQKEMARYSDRGWSTSFEQGAPSPQPPPGQIVAVRTPRNTDIRIVWPRNLPWLVSRIQTIQIQPRGFESHGSNYVQALLPKGIQAELASDSKSAISAIERLIPESEEGEASRRAEVVLSGRTREALQEQMKIILFRASNNLMDHVFGSSYENPWAHLNPILSIIELSGLMVKPLQLADEDFTMLAVSEYLFRLCFRVLAKGNYGDEEERAIRLAIWLLESGQPPNTAIDFGYREKTTALQISLRLKADCLTISLLDAGAHPDGCFVPGSGLLASYRASYYFYWQHPLFDAIASACETGNRDIVQRLVTAGASLDGYLALIKPIAQPSSTSPLSRFIRDKSRTDAMVFELLGFILENSTTGPGLATAISHFPQVGIAAAETGRKEVLEFLFDHGFDANTTSGNGRTALHRAAWKGHIDICRLLLDRGALVESVDTETPSPLYAAALEGHVDICRLLLDRGAPVESVDTGIPSPLYLACYHQHLDVVQLLHAHGANVQRTLDVTRESADTIASRFFSYHPHTPSAYQATVLLQNCRFPLEAATYKWKVFQNKRNRGLIDFLLHAGAEMPNSLLFSAIHQNDAELVSLVLQARPFWDIRFVGGLTPLQYAMDWKGTDEFRDNSRSRGHRELSVEICMRLLDTGLPPLDGDAVRAVKLGSWSLVERLARLHVTQGSSLSVRLPGGDTYTLLEAALRFGHPHMTEKALELDPNQYSPGALCAATWAVCCGRADMDLVTLLLYNRLHWLGSRLPSEYSDTLKAMEATSIGLAALWDNQRLLHCLQCSLPFWDVACVPECFLWQSLSRLVCSNPPYPFWHAHRLGALLNFATEAKYEVFQAFVDLGYRRDRPLISHLIEQEDVAKLQLLLQRPENGVLLFHGPEVDVLEAAIRKRSISLVDACLNLGENVNKKTISGHNPLGLAVAMGDLGVVGLLLEKGANIEFEGAWMLALATEKGNREMLSFLIEKGADVEAQGSMALFEATKKGEAELLSFLIDKGADIKSASPQLLSKAIESGDLETVDLLIAKGAEVHWPAVGDCELTALQVACISGHLGLAKRLIDLGVDINAPGARYFGRTALQGAAEYGRIDFIQLLLSEGAKTTGGHRQQYVRAVFLASREGHAVAVRLLKERGEWTAEDEATLKHAEETFDHGDGGWVGSGTDDEFTDDDRKCELGVNNGFQ